MPLITVSTSLEIKEKNLFMRDCSEILAKLTNKSEKYVMVRLFDQIPIYFDKNADRACFIDIKSIGSIDTSNMSVLLCDFISEKLKIPKCRTYICFENVEASNWAWDGSTFG